MLNSSAHRKKGKIGILAAAAVALALVASGCGGPASGSKPYAAAPGAGAAAVMTATPTGAAKVGTGNSTIGRLIVDTKGRTLYLFEKDRNSSSACYGACAAYWPPLLSHGKARVQAPAKQSLVGTIRRTNGARQVTYAGHPLYRFAGDTKSGQVTGEGLTDFGAEWDALTPAGKNIEPKGS